MEVVPKLIEMLNMVLNIFFHSPGPVEGSTLGTPSPDAPVEVFYQIINSWVNMFHASFKLAISAISPYIATATIIINHSFKLLSTGGNIIGKTHQTFSILPLSIRELTVVTLIGSWCLFRFGVKSRRSNKQVKVDVHVHNHNKQITQVANNSSTLFDRSFFQFNRTNQAQSRRKPIRYFIPTITLNGDRSTVWKKVSTATKHKQFNNDSFIDAVFRAAGEGSNAQVLNELEDREFHSFHEAKDFILSFSVHTKEFNQHREDAVNQLLTHEPVYTIEEFKLFLVKLSEAYYLSYLDSTRLLSALLTIGCLRTLKEKALLEELRAKLTSLDINEFAEQLLSHFNELQLKQHCISRRPKAHQVQQPEPFAKEQATVKEEANTDQPRGSYSLENRNDDNGNVIAQNSTPSSVTNEPERIQHHRIYHTRLTVFSKEVVRRVKDRYQHKENLSRQSLNTEIICSDGKVINEKLAEQLWEAIVADDTRSTTSEGTFENDVVSSNLQSKIAESEIYKDEEAFQGYESIDKEWQSSIQNENYLPQLWINSKY